MMKLLTILLLISVNAMAVTPALIKEEKELKNQYLSLKKSYPSAYEVLKLDERKIKEWYQAEVSFQKSYDQFQVKKQNYFAHQVALVSQCYFDELSKVQKLRLKKKFSDLMKQKNRYENHRELFGTENDFLRAISYMEMTDAQLAFVDSLEKVLKSSDVTLKDQIQKAKNGLKLIPYILKIQKSMLLEKHSEQGETPILDKMGEAMLAFGRINQVSLRLVGLENIPAPVYDGKTINVVSFEHANGLLDTLIQSAIPKENREGLGFFGAAQYVFPRPWANSLEKSDHYIVVNKGKEISRTRKLIDGRKLHGFMAAAEGFTSTGLYETRPISPLFINTYWELTELGYEINLVPMSYPENHLLYHELPAGPSTVSGVIGTPLSHADALKLRKLTGEKESVGYWLRCAWHEEHHTNEEKFLSAPSVEQLESALENRLWGNVQTVLGKNCLTR